jgi:hypothetical protein
MEEQRCRELFEVFCKTAELIFERDGYARSLIFVFGANEEMVIVPVTKDKEATQVAVRMAMVKLNAEALIQVGEVYAMMVKPGEPMPENGVKNDPRHVEQLMVVFESKDAKLIRAWDLVASDVAKRYLVRRSEMDEPDVMKTRWSGNWFKPNERKA